MGMIMDAGKISETRENLIVSQVEISSKIIYVYIETFQKSFTQIRNFRGYIIDISQLNIF